MPFALTSPAFVHEQSIPQAYTCDGADASIPLHWTDPPDGTRAFALIMEDPDAPRGTFTHWVLYDIPVTARALDEGISRVETLPTPARQGVNDFGKLGYGGPCPPAGPPHRYFVTLHALDRELGLPPGVTKARLLDAMRGHVLVQAQIMGRYQRAAARPQAGRRGR